MNEMVCKHQRHDVQSLLKSLTPNDKLIIAEKVGILVNQNILNMDDFHEIRSVVVWGAVNWFYGLETHPREKLWSILKDVVKGAPTVNLSITEYLQNMLDTLDYDGIQEFILNQQEDIENIEIIELLLTIPVNHEQVKQRPAFYSEVVKAAERVEEQISLRKAIRLETIRIALEN
ncbi:hypothetical protein [Paenibacillus sp. VTT E-133291]|uniref:hypothetical protein n=1 Tax=Paenibacillus sp. VTT E-133291 TaxID=1986223 RepID=UPI000BA065E9|nr:hypothetical protein [Paenibacillus sp. VTT E-133291]OZQ97437.1 hypothetical protein CA598_06475 [Paenibacillus sp. VTT E-133291]